MNGADIFLPGAYKTPRRSRSRLAQARILAGLSQDALGAAVGLSRAWISEVESGRTVPTLQQRIALGRALGMDLALLFDEDEEAE